jgi:hypothetical protein
MTHFLHNYRRLPSCRDTTLRQEGYHTGIIARLIFDPLIRHSGTIFQQILVFKFNKCNYKVQNILTRILSAYIYRLLKCIHNILCTLLYCGM